MTIKEFLNEIKNEGSVISDFISVKKYVPFVDKVQMAKEVADFSAEYDRGFIKFDSYKKYLAFVFDVIEAHTDLQFSDDWEDKMNEYDALCENELLYAIIDEFKRDYDASLMFLNMTCDDIIAENSTEASIAKLAQSASENLDVLIGTLSDKIEDLDIEKIIPKDLDLDKLKGFLSKIK